MWSEGLVHSLEHLCEWQQVSDFVDVEIVFSDLAAFLSTMTMNDDVWKESFLLKHFLTSKLKIVAEDKDGVVLSFF